MTKKPGVDINELRTDDTNWKWGIFYVSRQDPAALIPKRFGWGWTINFGSPWIWGAGIIVVGAIIWGVFF